jgi:hypothetical protein
MGHLIQHRSYPITIGLTIHKPETERIAAVLGPMVDCRLEQNWPSHSRRFSMIAKCAEFTLASQGFTDIHDVTDQVSEAVLESGQVVVQSLGTGE